MSDITSRLDAAEIIGEHVVLRQAGKTFKGLCPFHSEKTPSFNVNRERGLWYCFGCGAGGDLVSFVMKIQNLSFLEARDLLAKKAGIALPKESAPENRKRKRWAELLDLSLHFYHQMLLKSAPGEQGLHYLQSRGLDQKMIERFHLGMAPAGSRGLTNYLTERNYTVQEMRDVGLISRSDPPRDYFFKRVIFPIWNSTGSCIGFGGRSLGPEQPKYLNSPETPLFRKGENLYALHLAKPEIVKHGFALLSEGYLDCVTLHQYGFEQAVATLGTSLTLNQVKLLSRFAQKLIMVYDGDQAGLEAMNRALSVVQGTGMEIQMINLPEKEDPDSFLRKMGKDAFRDLLDQSLSPVDFVIHRMQSRVDPATPEGKRKIMDELAPLLRSLSDPILRDAYTQKISQSLKLSESAVRKSFSNTTEKRAPTPLLQPSREFDILSWILWEPSLAALVWNALTPADFHDPACQDAATALHQLWLEGKKSLSELGEISESVLTFISRLSNQPPLGSISNVESLLKAQKLLQTKKELHDLKQEVANRLKEGKVESTDEAYRKYLTLLQSLKRTQEQG